MKSLGEVEGHGHVLGTLGHGFPRVPHVHQRYGPRRLDHLHVGVDSWKTKGGGFDFLLLVVE